MNAKPLALAILIISGSGVFAADPPAPPAQTPAIRMAPASAGLPPLPAVVRDESQAQQEERLKWFREARFGMFIHWGVYAVPAGFWQGKPVSAEWIMNRGKIPVADYKAFAKDFTAAKYDPQAWAQLAADAGIKYVVITAKHHEGFTLYDSAYSEWNAVKAAGAKRDLLQPLADAVRAKGIKFGTYYSQAQDWVNPGGSTGTIQPWDPAQKGDFDEYLKKVSLPQVREILDKYRPDILWWDTEYQMTSERARPFFDLVMSHPRLIQNSRLGGGVLGDFRTSEQRIPSSAMLGRALEVNMTINRSWGYRSDDTDWKSTQTLIRNLSDIASKDGNFLLNVGPTAEGIIPEPEVERLRAIGRWLKVNGEAIYATRGSVYPKPLPWGRTTQKARPDGGTTLFLHIWEWPADGKILLPDIAQVPRAGRLLAGNVAVNSTVTSEGIAVTLPGSAPDADVSVAALEFDRPVEVKNAESLPVETGASGTLADPSKSPPTPAPTSAPAATPVPSPSPSASASFKFDFGPGKARDGYTKVPADAVYSPERGYGFDLGSKPTDMERGGSDPLTDGLVTTSETPLFFSVKVPEGNYRVTVTLGDAQGESCTTIRTEAGHIMAAKIVTAPGKFETRTFIANVRRPQLPAPPQNAPGGTEVHMFLRGEAEARAWDEKLTIELNNARPCLTAMEIVKDDAAPTIFTAGDSTVGDPRRGPGGNWPTQICQFFKPEVVVCNSAEGGETSKSFITGLRMDKVLSQMKAGDFFLIQFGHNDSKAQWPQTYTDPGTSFKAYLRVFIAETRRRGATLVLVTPMERRANEDSVGPWARAMREVAAQENVPLVDQWAMSKEMWGAMGPNVGQAFSDQTHLSGYGGYLLSKLIVAGIKKNVPALARFVAEDFVEMDPAHPEPPPEYLRQPGAPGEPARGPRGASTAPAVQSKNP